MNLAVLSGVRNWPSRDFFVASVPLDTDNLFFSTADNNAISPLLSLNGQAQRSQAAFPLQIASSYSRLSLQLTPFHATWTFS